MKRIYNIWVCPTCDEQHQFAGFCEDCGDRLLSVRCIPVAVIEDHKETMVKESSPVPAWFIEHFVSSLLRWCSGLRSG